MRKRSCQPREYQQKLVFDIHDELHNFNSELGWLWEDIIVEAYNTHNPLLTVFGKSATVSKGKKNGKA